MNAIEKNIIKADRKVYKHKISGIEYRVVLDELWYKDEFSTEFKKHPTQNTEYLLDLIDRGMIA